MIAAGIALLPDRYPTSLKTIESLLPQVDAILLSLNGFNSIPEGLVHPKIEVRYMGVNLGDIGKFHEWDGDFISCDDDLIYPGTYVEDFQTSKHRDTILTHHGSTFSALLQIGSKPKRKTRTAFDACQATEESNKSTFRGRVFRFILLLFILRFMNL